MNRPDPAARPGWRRCVLPLVLATDVLILDQLLKWLVLNHAPELARPGARIEVFSWFNLVLVENRGVSFGMFGSGTIPAEILAAIALGASILIGWMLYRENQASIRLAYGLIIGGALGNGVDRLLHGAVIDFVDVHWRQWHWPAFNLADSAIVVGVGWLLFQIVRSHLRPGPASD